MNARHMSVIARKDLRGLASERTILVAILIQLFIALFSSFLVVGLTSMYDPSSISRYPGASYRIGYAGADSPLRDYLEDSGDFSVYTMDLSSAVAALKERKLNAVIYSPDTPSNATEPIKITIYLVKNDLQGAVVQVKLKQVLTSYETELRVARADRMNIYPIPVEIPESHGGGNYYEFIFGLLIPLLCLMPAILSAALIIDLITEEYQEGTLEILLSTPVTGQELIAGKVLACIVLVPLQTGLWLGLLIINGINISNPFQILLQTTAFSLILILLGAIVALYYRERTSAQFLFSTLMVVLLLIVVSLPGNPVNLITRLAAGSATTDQWMILGVIIVTCCLLSVITGRLARYALRS